MANKSANNIMQGDNEISMYLILRKIFVKLAQEKVTGAEKSVESINQLLLGFDEEAVKAVRKANKNQINQVAQSTHKELKNRYKEQVKDVKNTPGNLAPNKPFRFTPELKDILISQTSYSNAAISKAVTNVKNKNVIGQYFSANIPTKARKIDTYKSGESKYGLVMKPFLLPETSQGRIANEKAQNLVQEQIIRAKIRRESALKRARGTILPPTYTEAIPLPSPKSMGNVNPEEIKKQEAEKNKEKNKSFKDNEKNNNRKKERKNFIDEILTGVKQILGKNALGDMIKWLILLFGKNHPVLASILLTLPTVIGTFRALSTAIKGLIGTIKGIWGVLSKIATFLAIFAGGGAGALSMMFGGSRGGFVRKAVLRAGKLSRSSNAVLGANSFIGKNVLKPFRNMALRTQVLKVASGAGGKNIGQLMAGTSKVTKGIPLVGSLLSFGGHMLAGDGFGKSLSHAAGGAGGSALGGIIGGAIGSVVPVLGTGIGAAIGSVVGGFFGDWIGGKLFDKMNKQDEALNGIEENTSWLGRIWDWVKEKFGGKEPAPGGNENYQPSGSTYGNTVHTDANQVMTMTPEQKKRAEEVYKYDSELYERAKSGKKRFSWTDGWKSAKDDLMDKWLREYTVKNLKGPLEQMKADGSVGWTPEAIAMKYSPEAKAYGEAMYKQYLINEPIRLKKQRERLDNTVVSSAVNNSVLPRSYKVYNTNGMPTVSLKEMKLQNGSLKYGSGLNTLINANAVGAMEDLDKIAGNYGVRYKVTSTIGDIHNKSKSGWGHGDGWKVDFVPENGVRDSKWKAFEEELRRQKFWSKDGVGTGAVGWHNAGWGYHVDAGLARGVIPKTGKTALIAGYDDMKQASAKAAEAATTAATQTSTMQLASNGLRKHLDERINGAKPGETENQRLERTRRMIFAATDVTGSLGVWGITHLNNHGGVYVGGRGGR